MRPRRSQSIPSDSDDRVRLYGRIAELEDRIRLLEARVRRYANEELARGAATESGGKPKVPEAKPARPRRRCPGCSLELPRGRRGENCVWCGFRFDAVSSWRARRASK